MQNVKYYLVPKKISNVVNPIAYHGWSVYDKVTKVCYYITSIVRTALQHMVANKLVGCESVTTKLLLPFEGEAPCNDTNIFWESHRKQHFRSKHARVSNLYIFAKAFMITE